MSNALYVSLIAACAAATYLTRLPGLWLGRLLRVTPRLKRGLDYVPIGIFAAMVVPSVITGVSSPVHQSHVAYMAAVIIALVIAWKTKHPLWTMLGGVCAIALLRLW